MKKFSNHYIFHIDREFDLHLTIAKYIILICFMYNGNCNTNSRIRECRLKIFYPDIRLTTLNYRSVSLSSIISKSSAIFFSGFCV